MVYYCNPIKLGSPQVCDNVSNVATLLLDFSYLEWITCVDIYVVRLKTKISSVAYNRILSNFDSKPAATIAFYRCPIKRKDVFLNAVNKPTIGVSRIRRAYTWVKVKFQISILVRKFRFSLHKKY